MREIYRRASNINWKNQDSKTLTLTIEENNQIVELNSSAALIWKWTDGSNTVDDISLKLAQFFKIPFQNAHEDVTEILEMWHEDNLVVLQTNRTLI